MKLQKETKLILKRYHTVYTVEKFWIYLICFFFLFITSALLYSSWLFSSTTALLDEQVLPTFESNTATLREIEKSITTSEEALHLRVNRQQPTSQKTSEVIE